MTQRRVAALTWEQGASSWDEVQDSAPGVGHVEWLRPGEQLGRYEVEAKLGEGGVAVVYRVRHLALGSVYALKVLKLPRPDLLERLYQEGRLQAKLNHPHVVRVIDVLEVRGALPALVMDLVEGQPLSEFLATLELEMKLKLFEQVVEAIACAHARGVIHRDIKPSNVLVGQGPDGALVAYVTDFGIAKHVREPEVALHTATGHVLGTPHYMAPEQLEGSKAVDHRADIFALGVMLYELCCGQRPFEGAGVVEIFKAIERGSYARLDPALPAHLEPIIARCLSLDPEQRWASCQELLAALRERADEPAQPLIQATPSSVRRLGQGLALVGLVSAAISAGLLYDRAAAPKALAPETPSAPKPVERSEHHRSALIAAGWQRAERQPAQALALLRAAEALRPGALRLQDVELLRRRGAASQVIPMGSEATALSVSPSGRYAATLDIDQRLQVVDLETGELKWSRAVTEKTAAWMLDYSPLGSYLLGYTRAGIVQHGQQLSARQYDAQDGEALRTMGHGKGVYGVAFDPQERWMVTRSDEAELIVWELSSGTPRARLEVGAMINPCITFNQDGRYLIAAGLGSTLHVFDAKTWTKLAQHKLPQHKRGTCLISASDDDPDLIALYMDGAVWSLSIAAGQLRKRSDYIAARPRAMALRGRRIIIGGNSEPVELISLDEPSRQALGVERVHDARVMSWDAAGALIATASTDGSVGVWSLASAELLERWYGAKSWLLASKLSRDGHLVVTTRGGELMRWPMAPISLPSRLDGAPETPSRWWWSSSGRALLVKARDGSLWWWRQGGAFEQVKRASDPQVLSVTMLRGVERALLATAKGYELLSLEDGSTAPLQQRGEQAASAWARWQLVEGAQPSALYAIDEDLEQCQLWRRSIQGDADELVATLKVQCGHIIEDGQGGYVVFGRGGEAFVVSAAKEVKRLKLEGVDGIAQIAISPTHGVIALARWRGGVTLLRRDGLKPIATLQEHAVDGAHRVEVSPDGELFATAGLDRSVRLWRAKDGALLHTFEQPDGEAIALSFVLGGQALVASTKDRMVWRWSTRSGELEWAAQTHSPLQALRELDGELVGLDESLGMWRFKLDALIEPLWRRTGRWSNLRVCRDSLRVVAVVPYPSPETAWAPQERCREQVTP